jgi:hypothetical protein
MMLFGAAVAIRQTVTNLMALPGVTNQLALVDSALYRSRIRTRSGLADGPGW